MSNNTLSSLVFPTMKTLGNKSADFAKAGKGEAGPASKRSSISREQALELLKKYNKEPFHIQHALTVEGVMRWYAKELGYGAEEEYWGITGLLTLSSIRRNTVKKHLSFCAKREWGRT